MRNNKLQLPTVTLMCVDCVNVERAIAVVEHCKTMCDFGAVKLLTSLSTDYSHIKIPALNSLVEYSIWMLTKCYKYIDTDYVLIIQRDGWILNPDTWENDWLKYDYIAPLFNQYDIVGSGGFSIRSKRLMQGVARLTPHWNYTTENANEIQNLLGFYEDGVISFNEELKAKYNYAPVDVANKFAQGGNPNMDNYCKRPFGFHGSYRTINHNTGEVDVPSDSFDPKLTDRLNELIELYVKK